MSPDKIKQLQKISHAYLKALPKDKEILEQEVYSYFKNVSLILLPDGTPQEQETLESYLKNGWLVTHDYNHRQEMIERGNLDEIKDYLKDYLKDIDVPEVINNWLRSSISTHKPEIFKFITEYKNANLDVHLGKLSVIYGEYEIIQYFLGKSTSCEIINDLLYTALMSENKEMGIFLIEQGASVKDTYEVIKRDVKSDAWVIVKYSDQLKWLENQEKSIRLKDKLNASLDDNHDMKKVKI